MDRNDERVFVADCLWLAYALGQKKKKTVCDASVRGDYFHYEDNVVNVDVSIGDSAVTITGKSEKDGGILNQTNPVVCIDEKGGVYRWHGEARYLFSHVRDLVCEAKQ